MLQRRKSFAQRPTVDQKTSTSLLDDSTKYQNNESLQIICTLLDFFMPLLSGVLCLLRLPDSLLNLIVCPRKRRSQERQQIVSIGIRRIRLRMEGWCENLLLMPVDAWRISQYYKNEQQIKPRSTHQSSARGSESCGTPRSDCDLAILCRGGSTCSRGRVC